MMSKLKIIFLSIVGELIKLLYKLHICRPLYGLNVADSRKHKVIVSLTSYGRRVSAVLPYTIYSLLRQTYKPDVIILWLDYDSWNERNLPSSIRKLQKYGLTIKFCNDIKSYKKLIPTLKLYPDEIIITVDDDIYYKKNMVERLIKSIKKILLVFILIVLIKLVLMQKVIYCLIMSGKKKYQMRLVEMYFQQEVQVAYINVRCFIKIYVVKNYL